jgi:hypothetical protein
MDQNTLFTIVIFFLLSNQLWNIFWDIGKALFYIVCVLIGLKVIKPELSIQVQNYIERIIRLDNSLVSGASKIVLGLLDSFGVTKLFDYKTEVEHQKEIEDKKT